jgi:hypothetical protein
LTFCRACHSKCELIPLSVLADNGQMQVYQSTSCCQHLAEVIAANQQIIESQRRTSTSSADYASLLSRCYLCAHCDNKALCGDDCAFHLHNEAFWYVDEVDDDFVVGNDTFDHEPVRIPSISEAESKQANTAQDQPGSANGQSVHEGDRLGDVYRFDELNADHLHEFGFTIRTKYGVSDKVSEKTPGQDDEGDDEDDNLHISLDEMAENECVTEPSEVIAYTVVLQLMRELVLVFADYAHQQIQPSTSRETRSNALQLAIEIAKGIYTNRTHRQLLVYYLYRVLIGQSKYFCVSLESLFIVFCVSFA